MGRLLIHGQQVSALAAVVRALRPRDVVIELDQFDPFADLGAEEAPDLLLLGIDGEESLAETLIRTVRNRHPDCAILAIHLHSARNVAERAILAGADAILPEPYRLVELSALLARQLGDPPDTRPSMSTRPGADSHRPPSARREPPPPVRPRSPSPTGDAPTRGAAPTNGPARPIDAGDLDALSVFVSGLAHEINNPLTTIRGFLQLLLHEDENGRMGADSQEAYQTMESESRRIADVIQELEYFSGTRRPARTMVDLPALIDESLRDVGLKHVRTRLTGDQRTALLDREQISFALKNLLGYLKAGNTSRRPVIEVAVGSRDGGVLITAAGRCEGSAAEEPDRLLIPLYASRTGEANRRISLASVSGIARAHGGQLQATHDDKGRLVFNLFLPRP